MKIIKYNKAFCEVYRKRYVEEELAKRLGKDLPQDLIDERKRMKTVDEMALEEVVPKKDDVVRDPGVQFVAGVSEVALDIRHKLKNIEATERAKARLLGEGDLRVQDGGKDVRKDFQRNQFPSQFGKSIRKKKN